jgi:hypothetical protein
MRIAGEMRLDPQVFRSVRSEDCEMTRGVLWAQLAAMTARNQLARILASGGCSGSCFSSTRQCLPWRSARALRLVRLRSKPDALDFLGDAGNYAISLFVVGMALRYRAMAALAKGATMGIFGLCVACVTAWHALHGTLPQAFTMGGVGLAALAANAGSFSLLWAYRGGDANMRSAWITRRTVGSGRRIRDRGRLA